ncbi:phosphatase PAP2 family protein [Gordonia caeni]|uniref:Phosphatase PAP2 family protein n=1 Tax=Gordonia caeni TaxID=1007097 RepID=A0ABP7NIR3_9ACTN
MSTESTDRTSLAPPRGEEAILVQIQSAFADRPVVLPAARGLSHLGEHALGWMGLAAAGAVLAAREGDDRRRRDYVAAGVGAFGAHAASVVIKRIVRRKRPHHGQIAVGVSTPSKLSFPSSHATSTTAAAILLGRAVASGEPAGWRRLAPVLIPAAIVPPMLASRLVLGVHYPSDVAAGALIGAASAGAVIAADKLYTDRFTPSATTK